MSGTVQQYVDEYYLKHGPCCAGCDWWAFISSTVGECTRRAPVGKKNRAEQLGLHSCSLAPISGHVLTTRDTVCGDFEDTFDWSKRHLRDDRQPPKRRPQADRPKRKIFNDDPFSGGASP